MDKEVFLIDSNSLITPHLTYYPFDFAENFWIQIEDHIKQGRIVVLDVVRNEILKGNDNLHVWIKNLKIGKFIDHRDESILAKYGEVLQYVQNSPVYKPSALTEWSKEDIADAWIIATAAVYGYTIISFETVNNGLNSVNPSREAKIPDVAKEFGVDVKNLYYMMRVLQIKL